MVCVKFMEHVFRLLRSFSGKLGSALKNIFDLEASGELLVYSGVVGVVAGLGAALFVTVLNWVSHLLMGGIMNYVPPGAGTHNISETVSLNVVWWAVLLVPALGGLVCGWLVYTFAPEAEGHGTDAMVRSFHRLQGVVRARVPWVKGLASIITIGSGGSAGREGPIAQIGAGFGSLLASRLKLSPMHRRYLMLAGAAGGIAAVFQAPLGGALFVCEVLYATTAVEFAAVAPAIISAAVAYSVFTGFHGQSREFITAPQLEFHGTAELPLFLVFALLCALVGFLYVRCFYGMRDHVFSRLPIPNMLKPAIGGLLLGAMVLAFHVPGAKSIGTPHVMGGGYGWIQQALDGELHVWWMLALLCVAKIVATSLTISSGGSGGVFAPSLFIGAMLGGAYGWFFHGLMPDYVPQPQVYVLVGMGGFFAGVAKVPLTAALMVAEMSGRPDLIVPLMLVSIVNVALLSSRVTLYEEQVRSLIDSPAHLGDFVVDVLEGIPVRKVFDPQRPVTLVPQNMSLAEIVPLVTSSESLYFPVVDAQQRLVGIFSLRDVRGVLHGDSGYELIVAADIATFPVITVTPDDDLHTALRRFTQKNIDEIPVVDPDDPTRLIGMLRRKEAIAAYHDQLVALRKER